MKGLIVHNVEVNGCCHENNKEKLMYQGSNFSSQHFLIQIK